MAGPIDEPNPGDPERPRSERRLVGRALAAWDKSRAGRRFPSRKDLDPGTCPELGSNAFLIAVGNSEEDDAFVESGQALIDALNLDPTGRKAIEVLPSATERGLSFCRAAAELKKPIADVGRFTNSAGQDVHYRSILMPLSDDQVTVNFLVGAFSFKFAH